jgi:exopolyphosphatase/guanosine-5'-triphosphate,3'-diphosphate pyrophosphatase
MPFLKQVAKGNLERMKGIEGVSKARRALLPYGAIVQKEIIGAMRPARIVVSAVGVREGYLHSLLTPAEQQADPLLSACEELARLRSRSFTHAQELADWTGQAFEMFGVEETEDEARYRKAACLLADIGWRAHPEYRGTQSLNIISHAAFLGVDHPGRAYLALTNLFRHEGVFSESAAEIRLLATPRYLERARILAGTMRVVYLLSAAMPGVIPQLTWNRQEDGTLEIVLPSNLAALYGERPAARVTQLGKVLGRRMALAIEGRGAGSAAK